MSKPLILITNDDGIIAPGIKALVEVASAFGEIVVVAPDSPQSGMGHAITITDPIRIVKVDAFPGVRSWECTGTPVDCVKLAKNILLKGRQIDLCLSGMNHGANSSISIIYSGTMSAAMEASLEGIPSIGFSLLNYSFEADFTAAKFYAAMIIERVIEQGMPGTNLLNVNFPDLSPDDIKGAKVCRQADGRWVEEFLEGTDPRGQKYYWLTGRFETMDDEQDTDLWALKNGYISIVPSKHDLTEHAAIPKLSFLENGL
jgi:5'-nucleotidase